MFRLGIILTLLSIAAFLVLPRLWLVRGDEFKVSWVPVVYGHPLGTRYEGRPFFQAVREGLVAWGGCRVHGLSPRHKLRIEIPLPLIKDKENASAQKRHNDGLNRMPGR